MPAMICRIEGELLAVAGGRAALRAGPITYELMVPACDEERLAGLIGGEVEFHVLQYLESQGQGASYAPRMVGFSSAPQRAFFEVLTTVRGLGTRRALRALRLPHQEIAGAIAAKDLGLLVTLPEIGRRLAETMVAQLSGKVDRFIEAKPRAPEAAAPPAAGGEAARDAIAVLTRLGEPLRDARRLVERALGAEPDLATPEAIVAAACRMKEGP